MAGRHAEAKTFTLGGLTFTTEYVAKFFEMIRAIGMEGRYQLPKYETVRQFVICGVFTHEEIELGDNNNTEIEAITNHLLKLDQENRGSECFRKFIQKGRVAVLLNNLGQHGETRLFDPSGALLRELEIRTQDTEPFRAEKHDYLKVMKRNFRREFGSGRQQFIVLFSHLIPCTIPEHMCSRLVREYADRNDANIIVSYDNLYQETDKRQALDNMTHDNIRVIEPKVRRPVVYKAMTEIQQICRGIKRLESCVDDETNTREDECGEECISKRQKQRENREKVEKGTNPGERYRNDKRKKVSCYRRQTSKPDKSTYWD